MEGEPPNFGAELKVQHGIAWMSDVEAFYRERAAVEKDYATKLGELAKKYFDKKAKKNAILSVGDAPLLTPGSLESATMTTWGSLLSTTELLAAEHDKLSTDLIHQCSDTSKMLSMRYEEFRQRHEKLERKLTAERDSQYSDLKKSKGAYDAICKEVEEKRAKAERDPTKGKAERSYQTQIAEMHNVKNAYLITINVTNAHKEKYYHSDVPDILTSLQDLNETRVQSLNVLSNVYCTLSIASHNKCIEHLGSLSSEITRNEPHLDSLMFIRHNSTPDGSWNEPPDFAFEPSPIWHDTSDIVVDSAAKIWLQNKISKSKTGLDDQRREVEKRRRDIETMKRKREGLRGKSSGPKEAIEEVEVLKNILASQEELATIDNKRVLLEIEVETVRQACGDIDRYAQSHKFKSTTFKIPTMCDLCNDKIWGLSSKGLSCKDCGYHCHSKCEMKVPASCAGVLDKAARKAAREERQAQAEADVSSINDSASIMTSSSTLGRSATSASIASSSGVGRSDTRSSITSKPPSAASTGPTRRVLAPPPVKYVSEPPVEETIPENSTNDIKAKVIYTFAGAGEDELAVTEGEKVTIVDPDDGSGWVRVRNSSHEDGLVPAAYTEIIPPSSATQSAFAERPSSSSTNASLNAAPSVKKKGPAVAPKRGAKKLVYVEALYDYQARTEDEFDMAAGDKFLLVNDDSGDGWVEVEKGGDRKSVPANYVEKC